MCARGGRGWLTPITIRKKLALRMRGNVMNQFGARGNDVNSVALAGWDVVAAVGRIWGLKRTNRVRSCRRAETRTLFKQRCSPSGGFAPHSPQFCRGNHIGYIRGLAIETLHVDQSKILARDKNDFMGRNPNRDYF